MSNSDRDYRTDEIVVHWRPGRCIHSARCIRALPAVFTPQERPWIHIDRASAEELAAAVRACPTGALQYTWIDGTSPEVADAEATVSLAPNGPLYLRGEVRIVDEATGAVIAEGTRVALCRCGQTREPPFCDGSHRAAGFRG